MIEFILSFISIDSILALPDIVKWPGLLILLLLAVGTVRALIRLKIFALIRNAFLFVVVAFILSRFGQGIAVLLQNSIEQSA